MRPSARVLIVSGHAVVRAGLRMLIDHREGLTVVGEAGDGADALAAAGNKPPDLILVDLDPETGDALVFLSELPAVAEGLKNRQIAHRLFISERTVRHHLTTIFAKLEVAGRLDLVVYAYRHGLVQIPR